MSELDEAWALGIAEAEARARATGRADIAEYLALRSSNDLMRKICQRLATRVCLLPAPAKQIARVQRFKFRRKMATVLKLGMQHGGHAP